MTSRDWLASSHYRVFYSVVPNPRHRLTLSVGLLTIGIMSNQSVLQEEIVVSPFAEGEGFSSLDLHPQLLSRVQAAGYERPTPIQLQAIPLVMERKDLFGLAQTGTGKTAAFVLPILHNYLASPLPRKKSPTTLILTPTRELAEQVLEVVKQFSKEKEVRATAIYGGRSFHGQISALKRGVDIIVGCPGRVLDHLQRKTLDLSKVDTLVLDEADQMFDMGFFPSIRNILQLLPKHRQSLFFSATMPEKIKALAAEMLQNPETVQVQKVAPKNSIEQALLPVSQRAKKSLLLHLLSDLTPDESVLIFTKTKHKAKNLGLDLEKAGHRAASLQGNLSQERRNRVMSGFRAGRYRVLVATDIAARGIDVSHVSRVVNYDLPDTSDSYIHRIGRTGRAERTGKAYTIVTEVEAKDLRYLERDLKVTIERKMLDGFDYGDDCPDLSVRQQAPTGQRPNGNSAKRRPSRNRPRARYGRR